MSVLKEVRLRCVCRGVNQSPAAASHAWRVHGAGGQPLSRLERVAERTVAESQFVMDGQPGVMGSPVSQIEDAREAQLSKRTLCCCARFSGLLRRGVQ